ncbi:MAG: FtsW/RodA/SpoVE family cell cycle protein [Roseburia sp.]
MVNLITQLSKYLMIFMFAFYAYECFAVFRKKVSEKKRNAMYHRQNVLMYLIHLDAFLVLYLATGEKKLMGFYLMQVVLITVIIGCYRIFYKNASRLLLNNMCMLLCVSFIILTRLSFDKAVKQYVICVASTVIALLIPVFMKKLHFFHKLEWFYAAIGILALLLVAVAGSTSYGAKISISIAGISVQPSEFVKIVFVFFAAAMLSKSTEFKNVVITTVVAAAHVLILVASKDLGGALIFFIAYLVILYVATRQPLYFFGGLGAGALASVLGYKLFNHVRVRVLAWKDPLSVIDKEGYQICQSLFAIGTGGWFGMGLYQGLPNKIPVVEQDFVFSAISEELGGIFALSLIMVCISCFLMFFNIAMQMKNQFYKLVALGLGTVYGFQVFLTIGGVTKFIPSTGVTLPLVSYGGSSLLSTMILFGIIQGLYLLKQNEGELDDKKDGKASKKKTKTTGFDAEVEDLS